MVWLEFAIKFYICFMKTHGSNVKLGTFEKFKPYYVRKLKEGNTYAYKYLVEMVELQDGFNKCKVKIRGFVGNIVLANVMFVVVPL